jgi:tetratricopeptide (TPR) repeat protein
LIAGVGLQHLQQLLAVHLAARRAGIASGAVVTDAAMLWANVARDWEILALGVLGLGCMLVRRRFELLIFPAWAAAAVYALATHSPLWYHHHLLLSVPVSACAGVAAGELFTRRPWPRLRAGGLAHAVVRLAAAVGLAVLAAALLQGRKREDTSLLVSSDRDRFAVEVMREYADGTHWVLADRPMFPFRAGLTTPPNTAVFTHKRILSGALTPGDLVDAVDRFQPEQVLLTWKTPPHLARELVRAIEGRYRAVLSDPERLRLHLYVRGDIASDPLPRVQRAVERMPWVAQGHYSLGLLWGARGQTEQAIAALTRAVELDPGSLSRRVHLADTMLAVGRLGEGFAILRAGLDETDRGRRELATALYGWRLATLPDGGLRHTAWGQAELRRVEQALAAAPSPDLVVLAAILAAQGRFEAAEDAIRKAIAAAVAANDVPRVARLSELRAEFRTGRPWSAEVRVPWQ